MELQESDRQFMRGITSFYLENLPPPLAELFIPQRSVPMTEEALPAFAAFLGIPGAARTRESMHAMDVFFEELTHAVEANLRGSFIRLGSRSAKDALGYASMKVLKAVDFMAMCELSSNIRRDVHWNYLYGYAPTFFVRPWMEIEQWREFRCFVRDGALYGISQYYCLNNAEFPEIAAQAHAVASAVDGLLRDKIIPAAEHDTFACDIYYAPLAAPRLIDYNPLSNRTGMCFFAEPLPPPAAPELRFRYQGRIAALPLAKENAL